MVIGIVFVAAIVDRAAALIPLYFYLIRGLDQDEKLRVLALIVLIPAWRWRC